MRVQRVAPLEAGEESWTVLGDDWRQVAPVEQFLSHLTDQRRSPNTVKAYAHDLKDYFEYLTGRGLAWDRLRYDELAAFKPWLRLPPAARRGEVSVLPATASFCNESTINRKLSAVTSFYEFHRRHGVEMALTIRDASRPVASTRTSFRPLLAHVKRSRPRRSRQSPSSGTTQAPRSATSAPGRTTIGLDGAVDASGGRYEVTLASAVAASRFAGNVLRPSGGTSPPRSTY